MSKIQAVTLPKWGLEMAEGTIGAWRIPQGAAGAKGAELVDIETEKIVNTLDLDSAGTVRRHVAKPGETLLVGALIAVLAESDVSEAEIDQFISAFKPVNASFEPGGASLPADASPPPAAPPARTQIISGEEILRRNEAAHASPIARRLADQHGVDLSVIAGTGKGGRISQADVEAAVAAGRKPTAPAPGTDARPELIPWTPMRRSIGQALLRAKQTVPHFYASIDIVMDEALALRAALNGGRAAAARISVNDMVLKAAALALADEPDVNVHVEEDGIRRFLQINIALAVAIDGGLLAPVLRDAGARSLSSIAAEAASLAARARARSLSADDLKGATFTVSNLGSFGVSAFDAIVSPPQAAVLAVGAARRQACEGQGGAVIFASVMTATLSCDHRAVDGALAGRFLSALKRRIEAPSALGA